jgi:hypothetical protein
MISPFAPALMKTFQTAKDLEEATTQNEFAFLNFAQNETCNSKILFLTKGCLMVWLAPFGGIPQGLPAPVLSGEPVLGRFC